MKVVNVRWAGAKRQVFNWVRLEGVLEGGELGTSWGVRVRSDEGGCV